MNGFLLKLDFMAPSCNPPRACLRLLGIALCLFTHTVYCQKMSQSWPVASETLVSQQDVMSAAPALPEAPAPQTSAASSSTSSTNDSQPDNLPLSKTPSRVWHDELHILASPAHISKQELRWLLPFSGATAVSLATDTHTMQTVVSTNSEFNSNNDTTSTILRDIFIGTSGVLFSVGELSKHEHERDTGLLAGEAMLNAYATGAAVKYVFLRERPQTAGARGHFFQTDAASDPSFVSGHSIVAWSAAAVYADSYSRPWQQAGIYTLASGVSLMRVLAQKHFPTDVLLGSATGWLIGHYVARAHLPKRSSPRSSQSR